MIPHKIMVGGDERFLVKVMFGPVGMKTSSGENPSTASMGSEFLAPILKSLQKMSNTAKYPKILSKMLCSKSAKYYCS